MKVKYAASDANQNQNEFPKTLLQAILSVIAAIIIGCILGDSVQAYFGTNMDYEVSNRYTERMNAVVTWFTDDMLPLTDESGNTLTDENGDPLLAVYFQRIAQALADTGDGVILRTASGEAVVWSEEGPKDVAEVYGQEVAENIAALLPAPDCLGDTEDTMTGEPIDDVLLYNITVRDGVVFFYVYYDDYGYVAITYDPNGVITSKDRVELTGVDGWSVMFSYET